MRIYTVGTEKIKDVYALDKMMRDNNIDIVFDVRYNADNPSNKEFIAQRIKSTLAEHKIDYINASKQLGNPFVHDKEMTSYNERIVNTDIYREAIKKMFEYYSDKNICLLGKENKHKKCHRRIICYLLQDKAKELKVSAFVMPLEK